MQQANIFPGAERVEQNLRAYIAFAAAMISPRSYRSESIKFQTLVQRRQSMIYWVNLKCMDVENKAMWNASQEALYHSFRLVNSPTEASEKLYMTKYDLGELQSALPRPSLPDPATHDPITTISSPPADILTVKLIEFDMYATPNPDVSQQQHLAWLLGFVCGVRPGSIAVARTRDGQFLQWKDVQIYRAGGRDSMNFQAKVTFRWLKGVCVLFLHAFESIFLTVCPTYFSTHASDSKFFPIFPPSFPSPFGSFFCRLCSFRGSASHIPVIQEHADDCKVIVTINESESNSLAQVQEHQKMPCTQFLIASWRFCYGAGCSKTTRL